MSEASADHNIVEQLHKSVQSFIRTVGADNKFAQNLLRKIEILQEQLAALSVVEQSVFLRDMKDSFRSTIDKVEKKLLQHMQFEQARNYSIVAAVIFVVICVLALFGYKLYKSLMEKEQKKQEKLKNKQSKKAKKSN